MKTWRQDRNARSGMTMLEMLMATAMLATVVAAVSVLLRTSHNAWLAHNDDQARIESAHATLRHVVRKIRQADTVVNLSPGPQGAELQAQMPNGENHDWRHVPAVDQVLYGIGSASDLLATHITALSFQGFQADGVTPTTIASEIRLVKCTATVQLPHESGGQRTISCMAWLRSW